MFNGCCRLLKGRGLKSLQLSLSTVSHISKGKDNLKSYLKKL